MVETLSKYKVSYPVGLDLRQGTGRRARWRPGSRHGCGWSLFHLKGFKRHDGTAPQLGGGADRELCVPPARGRAHPEWFRVLKRRHAPLEDNVSPPPPPQKVLVLVTGAGQPRDATADQRDNSTESTGRIIESFVRRTYPDVQVVVISDPSKGIFRYDDNVRFVKEQVLPLLEEKRSQVVSKHGDRWQKKRTSALPAARAHRGAQRLLRSYVAPPPAPGLRSIVQPSARPSSSAARRAPAALRAAPRAKPRADPAACRPAQVPPRLPALLAHQDLWDERTVCGGCGGAHVQALGCALQCTARSCPTRSGCWWTR